MYFVIFPYYVIISCISSLWVSKKNLLDKIGKNNFKKLDYWLIKNPNQNFRVSEFWGPKYFGSDTVHHYSDPKFWGPEPKFLLVRPPEP